MASQGIAAALGYGFWLVVSRRSDIASIGLASSVLSAVAATTLLSSVGIAVSAVQEIRPPSASNDGHGPSGQIRTSLLSTLVLSVVAGPVLVLLSLIVIPALWQASTGLKLMVVAAVVASAVGSLVDYCAIALRMSSIMLGRNIFAAGGRLAMIVLWPSRPTADAVFFCWLLPAVLSLAAPLVNFRSAIVRMLRRQRVAADAALADRTRLWWGNHLTSVGGAVGTLILPVLVVDRLGAHDAGLFYPTWTLGGVFFMISPAIASAFLAGIERNAASLRGPLIFCVKATAALLALPTVICLAVPHLVLGILGSAYARSAAPLLVVLALSALPDAVSNIGVAVLRVRGLFTQSALVNFGITAVTLALAWPLLRRFGILGGGLAWLCAQTLGAIAAVLLAHAAGRPERPARVIDRFTSRVEWSELTLHGQRVEP